MTEDQDAKDLQLESGSKTFTNKNKDIKKTKTNRPLTKIILRRLPPTMTEEAFLEQVSPIPEHDHFYFSRPDPSLGNNVYSRAYINFINIEDIYLFRDKFDGYVFLDEKGVEYVGIVEYAPFQRILKRKKKKDPKCSTIESDPVYQDFLESLTREPETENQPKLEYSYPISDGNDKKVQSTPLLEYLAARKQDKRGRDERRRRENDKRKMRIERKSKDYPIKRPGDISEDETYTDNNYYHDSNNNDQNYWLGEPRVYHKSRAKCGSNKTGLKTTHSDEFLSTDSDWDSHFPALAMKTHNTFTLTSANVCSNKDIPEASQKSGGDTHHKEEEYVENDVKKIKSRDWEKEKSNEPKDDPPSSESKDGTVFESKTFREQRKAAANIMADKKKKIDTEKKENSSREDDQADDTDKGFKKEKRDKFKESPREQKSKKYSDTRKDRIKQNDFVKSDKQSAINKIMAAEGKMKSLNHDDIKPFTQLPHVKTDDLVKIIENMEKKTKLEEIQKSLKESSDIVDKKSDVTIGILKPRRRSLESCEMPAKEESVLERQKSLDDRGDSTDREGSEEKEKNGSTERRTERRIRNKDRPSLVIYQPGMGKFSKQRLAKEKDTQPVTANAVNDSEKKDT